MCLIVTAPVHPHTERQDEEAKANHGAGRTYTSGLVAIRMRGMSPSRKPSIIMSNICC
jgi:hypothetical protein